MARMISMDKYNLFQNLVFLAASDGKFTDEEIQALAVRAENWNISNEDFDSIIVGLQTSEVEMVLPKEKDARVELLTEMVRVMAADGELAEIEKELCATAAARMDFTMQEFEQILSSLLSE